MAPANNGGRREAVHLRHVYIHDDKIGVEHCDNAKSLGAISSLSYNLHLKLPLENSAYHLQQFGSVVHHHDAWTRWKLRRTVGTGSTRNFRLK